MLTFGSQTANGLGTTHFIVNSLKGASVELTPQWINAALVDPDTCSTTVVSEPSTDVLHALGLVAFARIRHQRRR